ncbi:hypothetical protein CEXT_345441 [Caerostris extrusa]|uniref:Uncharacterized protein n=1 Tax=Caerostris extrusa TaxID=172846 RepID=A0AAV4R6L4_CAEEX|nr:hypothetical protein CEXT_345441 [Caerostris extrusa]
MVMMSMMVSNMMYFMSSSMVYRNGNWDRNGMRMVSVVPLAQQLSEDSSCKGGFQTTTTTSTTMMMGHCRDQVRWCHGQKEKGEKRQMVMNLIMLLISSILKIHIRELSFQRKSAKSSQSCNPDVSCPLKANVSLPSSFFLLLSGCRKSATPSPTFLVDSVRKKTDLFPPPLACEIAHCGEAMVYFELNNRKGA